VSILAYREAMDDGANEWRLALYDDMVRREREMNRRENGTTFLFFGSRVDDTYEIMIVP